MAALHYNLNLLTMVALTVSVGILVDDSIVVLENITRHLAHGQDATPGRDRRPQRDRPGGDHHHPRRRGRVRADRGDDDRSCPRSSWRRSRWSSPPRRCRRCWCRSRSRRCWRSCCCARRASTWTTRTAGALRRASGTAASRRSSTATSACCASRCRSAGWSSPSAWRASPAGIALLAVRLHRLGLLPERRPERDRHDAARCRRRRRSTRPTRWPLQMEHDLRATYPEVRSIYTRRRRRERGGPSTTLGGANQAQITGLLVPPARAQPRQRPSLRRTIRRVTGRSLSRASKSDRVCRTPSASAASAARRSRSRSRAPTRRSSTRLARRSSRRSSTCPARSTCDNSNDNVQTQLRAKVDWTRAADLGVAARDAGAALRTALDGCTSNANQFRQSGSSSDSDPRPDRRRRAAHARPDRRSCRCLARTALVKLGQFTTLRPDRDPDLDPPRQPPAQRDHRRSNAGDGWLVGDVQTAVQKAVAGVDLPAGYTRDLRGPGQPAAAPSATWPRAWAWPCC